MRRRLVLGLASAAAAALVLGGGAVLWTAVVLRSSLPQLDGERPLPGLSAPVTIARDRLGIPTVRGASREDVSRATGFLHAQDRFFQMDLSRRRAAGELAALVGPRALDADRAARRHRFRAIARRAAALLAPSDREVLEAYTAGVNEGLRALGASPFEYLLLRQNPEPWHVEDSLLVVLSMFLELQSPDGAFEATLGTMADVLPPEAVDFLAPVGTDWDSPLVGGPLPQPPVPEAARWNPRGVRAGRRAIDPARVRARPEPTPWDLPGPDAALGSNNWAVAGRFGAHGGAIVANDMHLAVRVPNTWYRALLEWPSADPAAPHRLVGLTLPGLPTIVAGSNTHVAWGFTNTYADWSDIVLLEVDPSRPDQYRTPAGWRRFDRHVEVIAVAGKPAERFEIAWTIWGPVLPPDHAGRLRAYRWVAHSAERLAVSLLPLELVTTVDEAVAAVNGLGAPGQNFVAADRAGRIGWTIFGSIPRRRGTDGRLPSSWADGTRGWDGWLDPSEYPRVIDPADGRIWTANARVVDGRMLAVLGTGNYDIGSRARVIRDHLRSRDRFTERGMLDLQLDASAAFLERWRRLALDTLGDAAVRGHAGRARFRDVIRTGWTGTASPDSAAYRLVRMFREEVVDRVMSFALAAAYEADPAFDHRRLRSREGPVWTLVTGRPPHLLDPRYHTWDDLLTGAVDAVVAELSAAGAGDLADRRWAEANPAWYRHPLSPAIPFFGRWLDMPLRPLPGDLFTVRVHWRTSAASERMVVSPGREAEGILHMPTGQSGHPLSPFYANSHEAWLNGDPTPLLPGEAEHTLVLVPARGR